MLPRRVLVSLKQIFQGNTNYFQEVRNNFIPPIEARFIRICPFQWHQRIALKMELLGCQPHAGETNLRNLSPIWPISHAKHDWISFCWSARPRILHPTSPPPRRKSTVPPLQERTTHTPNIRNTTMPPHSHDGIKHSSFSKLTCELVSCLSIYTYICNGIYFL